MVEEAFLVGKRVRESTTRVSNLMTPLGREREEIISLFIGDIEAAKWGGGIGEKRQEDVDSDVEKRNCWSAWNPWSEARLRRRVGNETEGRNN